MKIEVGKTYKFALMPKCGYLLANDPNISVFYYDSHSDRNGCIRDILPNNIEKKLIFIGEVIRIYHKDIYVSRESLRLA